MSINRARRLVLERLGSGTTAMVSLHLALPTVPAWADGADADGHAVLLIGAHELRKLPGGDDAVRVGSRPRLTATCRRTATRRLRAEGVGGARGDPALRGAACWPSRAVSHRMRTALPASTQQPPFDSDKARAVDASSERA